VLLRYLPVLQFVHKTIRFEDVAQSSDNLFRIHANSAIACVFGKNVNAGRLSIFPSKIKPTISLFLLIIGPPLLPPMMSFVKMKLTGVDRSKSAWIYNQRRQCPR